MAESKRNIFEFFNGERNVFGDPLAILCRFHAAMGGEVDKYLKHTDPKTNSPTVVNDAWLKLVMAANRAFPLVPFDPETGTGAMFEDAVAVIRQFLLFLSKKKVTPASSPTSSQPTAQVA